METSEAIAGGHVVRPGSPVAPAFPDRHGPPAYLRPALDDIVAGSLRVWFWGGLAVRDIKTRYHGSMLGPFWMTLSTAILITVIGFIYQRLLKVDATQYLPYIAVGIVLWHFIAGVITSAGATFVSAGPVMQQARMPVTVHILREVARQFISFAHSVVLIPLVFLLFGKPIGLYALLAIPGVILLAINAIWISTLIGIISARFRDLQQILMSTIQVLFFCTPVFWYPEAMGSFGRLMVLNPLYAIIDVVRAPIMGEAIHPTSWPIALATAIVGSGFALAFFARYRSRIVFWVG